MTCSKSGVTLGAEVITLTLMHMQWQCIMCDKDPHTHKRAPTHKRTCAWVQVACAPAPLCCFIESHGELILCLCLVIIQHPHGVHAASVSHRWPPPQTQSVQCVCVCVCVCAFVHFKEKNVLTLQESQKQGLTCFIFQHQQNDLESVFFFLFSKVVFHFNNIHFHILFCWRQVSLYTVRTVTNFRWQKTIVTLAAGF